MIAIFLFDLRWRLLTVALTGFLFYFLEPAFHIHDAELPGAATPEMGPLGISASLAYLAGIAMIVLLGGFLSSDRREGYTRIFFSHPTAPLTFYGVRWILSLVIACSAAAVFLAVGQFAAWGTIRGGAAGLLLALLAALVYGALMAFASAALPRGDSWVVFLLFLPTFFPQLLTLLEMTLPAAAHRSLLFVLPPQSALQEVYRSLLTGDLAWAAAGYVLGYATVWLAGAIALLKLREWP